MSATHRIMNTREAKAANAKIRRMDMIPSAFLS